MRLQFQPRILCAALALALLAGCAEPTRADGQLYIKAAAQAMQSYPARTMTEKLFQDDCSGDVTCLNIYHSQDAQLVEAVTVSLMRVQAKLVRPGVKLTVYASPHGQSKVVFREVTIK